MRTDKDVDKAVEMVDKVRSRVGLPTMEKNVDQFYLPQGKGLYCNYC